MKPIQCRIRKGTTVIQFLVQTPISLTYILISSTNLRLGIPKGFFFPVSILKAIILVFLFWLHVLLIFMFHILFFRQYQVYDANYEVPLCEVFSTSHFHPFWAQIFASGSCFQIPILKVKDHVSPQQQRTTGNILIKVFLIIKTIIMILIIILHLFSGFTVVPFDGIMYKHFPQGLFVLQRTSSARLVGR